MPEGNALFAADRAYVWHPYAAIRQRPPSFPSLQPEGVLRLADGREIIDGMALSWSAIHGYSHLVLNQAVERQLRSMAETSSHIPCWMKTWVGIQDR